MLLVGDQSYNSLSKDIDIVDREIICEREYVTSIMDKFKIKNEIITKGNITRKFTLANNKTLTIHNASNYVPLMFLLVGNVALGRTPRLISHVDQYMLLEAQLNFKFKDVDRWERVITHYNILNNLILDHKDPAFFKQMQSKATSLFTVYTRVPGMSLKDEEIVFKHATMESLFNLFNMNATGKRPLYTSALAGTPSLESYIKFNEWFNEYDTSKKSKASVEVIYVVAATKYALNEVKEYGKLVSDPKTLLYKAYMDIITSQQIPSIFLKKHMKENFFRIKRYLNPECFQVAIENANKFGDLDEI